MYIEPKFKQYRCKACLRYCLFNGVYCLDCFLILSEETLQIVKIIEKVIPMMMNYEDYEEEYDYTQECDNCGADLYECDCGFDYT